MVKEGDIDAIFAAMVDFCPDVTGLYLTARPLRFLSCVFCGRTLLPFARMQKGTLVFSLSLTDAFNRLDFDRRRFFRSLFTY